MSAHPRASPLSGRSPHLYVTRNAVLGYQEILGGGFETIRRALTTRILGSARPDPENDGCYLLDVQAPAGLFTFRVYTIRDGPLLVVPKVALAETVS